MRPRAAPGRRTGRSPPSPLPTLLAALAIVVSAATPAAAQSYELAGSSGERLSFARDTLLAMHAATRALVEDLERDPAVLYYTGFTPAVPADSASASYPWNAVVVLTDSTAAVRTPGNLREADRAYSAYAVIRMRNVRDDPDVPCDSLLERERRAVSAFIDGWVVARTLFGAPPYPPLTDLAFARRDGVLPGLLVAREDPQLGGCAEVWRRGHPEAMTAYRRWKDEAGDGAAAGEQSGG